MHRNFLFVIFYYFIYKTRLLTRCDMASIVPMQRNKPNITYLLGHWRK